MRDRMIILKCEDIFPTTLQGFGEDYGHLNIKVKHPKTFKESEITHIYLKTNGVPVQYVLNAALTNIERQVMGI